MTVGAGRRARSEHCSFAFTVKLSPDGPINRTAFHRNALPAPEGNRWCHTGLGWARFRLVRTEWSAATRSLRITLRSGPGVRATSRPKPGLDDKTIRPYLDRKSTRL